MKVLAKFLVCALAFAAVANGADNLRAGCEANDATPAPTTGKPLPTPTPTTLAPTTPGPTPANTTPSPTTPAPTSAVPTTPAPTLAAPTTPAPTTAGPTTPAPTTPAPTTPAPTTPAPTTPAPTTPAPTTAAPTTPAPTTPAPTTSAPTPAPSTAKPTFSKDAEYRREGVDCNGLLRLPGPAGLTKTNCVEDYKVVFTDGAAPITGCVACKYQYTRVKGDIPLCGGLPLCTIFSGYGDLVEGDLMCVLDTNGAKPIDTECSFFDN